MTLKSTYAIALLAMASKAQQFTYGNACANLTDGFCGFNCNSCLWSWPSSDPQQWGSTDAACRCETGGSDSGSSPSPSSDYTYGDACANLTDGFCGADCSSCLWSWPSNDPQQWGSTDAACRCETGGSDSGPSPSPSSDYTYGNPCGNLTDGYCGTDCSSCLWSWPSNDPLQWSSTDAACRCETGSDSGPSPQPSSDYTFGNACANLTDGECGYSCTSCLWSWPTNDQQQWNSSDAACRCESDGSSDGSDNSGGGSDDGSHSPDPDDPAYRYAWGDTCATNTDGDCGTVSGCSSCKWSWPRNDPLEWGSQDAKCRCQTDDLIPDPIPEDMLEWGDDCSSLTDQACGDVSCIKCAWSWPKWDPNTFRSLDAMCRCQYEEGEEIPVFSYPELLVEVDGVQTSLWVQWDRSWSEAETNGAELGFDYNNRMYLSTQQQFDKTKYFTPDMLGGSVEYDVDLSEVGCGCVAALYTTLMPSVDQNDDPFGYCDANRVGGHWCPEFDVMEANKFSFHTTAHKCDTPTNGVYDNCDRDGTCTLNIHQNDIAGEFLPGSTLGIDTNYEFHFKLDFIERDGQFVGYTVTMTQGDKQVVQTTGDCMYLTNMTQDITRMAWAISHWASDGLDWLQKGQCTGTCSRVDSWTSIKNLKFTTAASTIPETVFKYGDECTSDNDQTTCGEDCLHCHQSWPVDDPLGWGSQDAACRCLPMQRASHGYTYGQPCSSNTSGACGDDCTQCHMSWPSDDLALQDSAESMCRCKPQEEGNQPHIYGASCPNHYDMLCGADCHHCRETWPEDDIQKWYSDQMVCRCKAEDIRKTIFAESCNSLDAGICGTHCRECNMSWEASDPSSTRACRCKRSW